MPKQLNLGDVCRQSDYDTDNDDSTADIAANAPRYRRKSSTFIDGIHDVPEDANMAPAQLYSTMSGRLFHSGRIVIVMVGLPARGTSLSLWHGIYNGMFLSHASPRHSALISLRLGVKTRIFHLGDYRRATVGEGNDVPEDYFYPDASPASVMLRQKILKKCREDIYGWLNHENGQVAIYDAVNPTAAGRRSLAKEFAKHDVQTLFVESYVDDENILRDNARNVKIGSPDFANMDPDEAAKLYIRRIGTKIPTFETMDEKELNYIKMTNAGQKFFYNNVSFNYLSHRIVFYLTNTHIKTRATYFVRAGAASGGKEDYKADAPLSEEGIKYARVMTETLLKHREQAHAALISQGGAVTPMRQLTVWCSTRVRNLQTADAFKERGFRVRQRTQMSQLNPGVCERLGERAIRRLYPEEVEKHELDPYHHRYPRAESYHDLAVRMEPIILELEREQNDLVIIAHESVLRVLYGYLMHCSAMDIPKLTFPRNEIIEIIPAAYQNEVKRIHIPGLDPNTVPGSPEDIRIPVAENSGIQTPSLLPDPELSNPGESKSPGIDNTPVNIVGDKIADED
ncbi:bifunctional 6-phosphofructo-2-kinase/fructose-2,6-bisphosphate 2-phosphatase [Xylaria intraflava]|nr:bifunctional 6-phosphofructo-2-kinase/fructose-2,6-bisphosphate 2-phosphatase [Xylaria intraflava]